MSPPALFSLLRSISAGGMTLRARTRSRKPGAKRSSWASMRSVMSTVAPFGTWQYTHAVCLPLGARDGSNRLCWPTSMNGLAGIRPRATASSQAAISSRVPPRWTVPARRHSGARQGIGPSSA